MTTLPDVIQQSELLDQLVLNRTTMEELGRIETLWMYPSNHQVLGFICKSGFLGKHKLAFKLSQLVALGANGILTQGEPEATDGERVRQLESLLNCEVWSDAGNKVGRIVDYVFDLQTGKIKQYLFVSSGWIGVVDDVHQLVPARILSFGRKRVLIPEAAVANCQVYRPGFKQKLEFWKEDYGQVKQEFWAIAKKAQTATEQAKERAQSLSHRAKEQVQIFNEQLKEKSQTLVERVKEQTHNLGEQVEEGFQTMTVQAREILDPTVELDPPEATAPPATETTPSPSQATNPVSSDEEDEFWDLPETLPKPTPSPPSPPVVSGIPEDDDEPWI